MAVEIILYLLLIVVRRLGGYSFGIKVMLKNNEMRIYQANEVVCFRKTKEVFGELSNMASGFPLTIRTEAKIIPVLSTEALYQACRFPHLPEVQAKILEEKSPMTAKMVGKPFRNESRPDWEQIKVKVMRWCLRIKLAQNYFGFGRILESTFDKQIVEDSRKDDFWGAVRDKRNQDTLIGTNALGRLLMELRQSYYLKRFDYQIFFIEPIDIPGFKLLDSKIKAVDERCNFINYIKCRLHLDLEIIDKELSNSEPIENKLKTIKTDSLNSDKNSSINEEKQPEKKSQLKKTKKQKTDIKQSENQPILVFE